MNDGQVESIIRILEKLVTAVENLETDEGRMYRTRREAFEQITSICPKCDVWLRNFTNPCPRCGEEQFFIR